MSEEEKSKKESKVEKITQEQYESMLLKNLENCKLNLRDSKLDLEDAVNNYYKYVNDKNKYRLEFYKIGNQYFYKRFKRQIGFKK